MATSSKTSAPDWQCNKSVTECLSYSLHNQVACDVTFRLTSGSPQQVSAHRFMLSMRSPVFFAMFHGSLAAGNEDIVIEDVAADAFLQMLGLVELRDTFTLY